MTAPDYIIRAIAELLRPFVRADEASVRRAVRTLDNSRRETATLGAIAEAWGVGRKTAYARLRAASVAPVGMGGRTGREAIYNLAAVEQAVQNPHLSV